LGHRRSDHWSPRRQDYVKVNLEDRYSRHHHSKHLVIIVISIW